MKASPFFKNVSYLLFLNLLIKPLWIFGVDRQIQNIVGHQVYGTYFSLLNLSLVFSFVTDAGVSGMINRTLAAGAAYNVARLLRLKMALGTLYFLLVAATAWLTGAHQWNVLLPIIGIQAMLSFFNFFRSIITAHQLFTWDAWLSVIDKILMLLLFLPLLYGPVFQKPINLLFFLHAQLGCTTIAVGIALAIVLKNHMLHQAIALQKTAAILKAVAPYAIIVLAMSAHNRLDGFLLERLHANGRHEAGVYAASYRLLDAANMTGYLVASFLVPFLARHRNDTLLVQRTVLTARHGLLLFGVFTTLSLTQFAAPVQGFLYSAATPYTAQVLQWCLPVLPAYLLLQVYGSLLTAMAQLKIFSIILTCAVVINVVLNVVLIPQWGALGCCIAAITSQYACAISVFIVAASKNKVRYDWKGIGLLFLTTLLLAALFYIGRQKGLNPLLLLSMGGVLAMMALFAYLPLFKRFTLLAR